MNNLIEDATKGANRVLEKRHYLKLCKWNGDLLNEVVSWDNFSDESMKYWLSYYNADYAIREERFSLSKI